MTQICTLTARRAKPGQLEALKDAWRRAAEEGPQEIVSKWSPVYACRDVSDENVLLTFGFFQGTLDELRQAQSGGGGPSEYVKDFVEEELFDGAFEVVDVYNEQA